MAETDREPINLPIVGAIATAFNFVIPSDKLRWIALTPVGPVGWFWSTTKYFIRIADEFGQEIEFIFPEPAARRHMDAFEAKLRPQLDDFYVWKHGGNCVIARKETCRPAIITKAWGYHRVLWMCFLGDCEVSTNTDEVNAFVTHFINLSVELEEEDDVDAWLAKLKVEYEARQRRRASTGSVSLEDLQNAEEF